MGGLLRIGDAARRIGASPDTLRDWLNRGYITAIRTPSNQLMFDEDEINELRNGDRQTRGRARPPGGVEVQDSEPESRPKADSQKERSWKELPPWESEVAEARAALTVDELASLREQQAEEREKARADAAARLEFQRAEARRLTQLKQYVFQVVYIPSDYKQDVAEAIETFTTSAKVPAWLQPWEQQKAVVSHARGIIAKREDEKHQREAAARELQAEADRKQAEANRHAAEKLGQEIAKLFDRTKKKNAEKGWPTTIADARRARRENGEV